MVGEPQSTGRPPGRSVCRPVRPARPRILSRRPRSRQRTADRCRPVTSQVITVPSPDGGVDGPVVRARRQHRSGHSAQRTGGAGHPSRRPRRSRCRPRRREQHRAVVGVLDVRDLAGVAPQRRPGAFRVAVSKRRTRSRSATASVDPSGLTSDAFCTPACVHRGRTRSDRSRRPESTSYTRSGRSSVVAGVEPPAVGTQRRLRQLGHRAP